MASTTVAHPALWGKLIISLINLGFIRLSFHPPNPVGKSEDQHKFRTPGKTRDVLSQLSWLTVPVLLRTTYALQFTEIYLILSTRYPSLRLPLINRLLKRCPAPCDFKLSNAFIIGSTLLNVGSYFRILCYRHLGRFFTFELTFQKDHELVTNGPYSFVRHPSYFAWLIACSGLLTVQFFSPGGWWVECRMWKTRVGRMLAAFWISYLTALTSNLLMRIPKEDQVLRAAFKEKWLKWAKETPYAVIPYVF